MTQTSETRLVCCRPGSFARKALDAFLDEVIEYKGRRLSRRQVQTLATLRAKIEQIKGEQAAMERAYARAFAKLGF